MRHGYFGKQLSRSTNERKQLLRNLARDIFIHGTIKTTVAKAKAVQPIVETLITKAKNGTNASLNVVRKTLAEKSSVDTLLADIKGRFSGRTSGYTRIVKTGIRGGDGAEMAIIGFVDTVIDTEPVVSEKKKTVQKKGKIEKKISSEKNRTEKKSRSKKE